MRAGKVLRMGIVGSAIAFVAIGLSDAFGISSVHRGLADVLFGPSGGEAAPWQQLAHQAAIWLQESLIDLLPSWATERVRFLPPVIFIIAGPLIAFTLTGLGLKKFHDAREGFRKTGDMFKEAPSPSPATHEGQEALRVLFEAGRAESAEMKAKLDAILAAVSPKASAAPLSSAEQAAKEGAVVGLVSDPQPAAQEAARDLAAGDVTAGFDALEREARAAEASAAEKWQRLGALAAGVDTARARAAYEQAFRLDPTDFWTCVMLARLRQQAGDLRAAGEAARAAKQAVRTDRERYVANFWVGATCWSRPGT